MSEWISIKEAAKRHNLDEEHIQLWVDMKAVTAYVKDCNTVVNDESLRAFLKFKEQGVSLAYVEILERLCIGRSETCVTYAILLGARDKELLLYKEAKSERDTFRRMWLEQNDRIRDLEIELVLEQASCCQCRFKKLCLRLQKLKFYSYSRMKFSAIFKKKWLKSGR